MSREIFALVPKPVQCYSGLSPKEGQGMKLRIEDKFMLLVSLVCLGAIGLILLANWMDANIGASWVDR